MKSDRKAELVAAATELIAERGYDSFSYADLSQRSGLAKPSIHHHFPTKGELVLAVLDAVQASQQAQVQACVRAYGAAAAVELLKGFVFRSWGSQICPLASLQSEFNVLPAAVQSRLSEVSATEVRSLSALLQAYATSIGKALALPAEDAARVVLCAAKGALLYGRTDQSVWIDRVVAQTLALLLNPPAIMVAAAANRRQQARVRRTRPAP